MGALVCALFLVQVSGRASAAVATPAISAPPDVIVGEASGHVDLVVSLNVPGSSSVTVNYQADGSTASAGTSCNAGFVQVSGTLTFLPGVTTQTVRVDLLDCAQPGFRSFRFGLFNPGNATIARAATRVGIVGDQVGTGTPGLFVRDATVDTGAGTVLVPVLLGGPGGSASTSTVTVGFATQNGTAVAGTDYTATSGTLSFAPGQTVVNVPVAITARSGSVGARRFAVTLTGPVNASIADGTGVVTIGASGAPAVAIPAVSAAADQLVGESDGYVDLPVTLNVPGTSSVTVNYQADGSTASAGTSCNAGFVQVFGTLTFLPGVTTQTVRVDLLDCGVASPGAFSFDLFSPSQATITRASTTITIIQTPTAPAAPTAVHAAPGNSSAVVSFTPASNGGSAVNAYTVTSSPGAISASSVTSPITVTGLTNGVSYTFTVTATNPVGTSGASASSAAVVPGAGSGAPAAPTGVTAVSGSTTTATGSLVVTFTLGTDNGSPITGQTATCTSSTGGATASGTHSGATAAPITVGSLTTGKKYTCTVKATNSIGTGPASAHSPAVIVGSPAAPTSVVAARVAAGQLRVSFTPGANNGSAITSFTAVCKSSNGGTAGSKTGASSPLTVTGLTAGRTYTCTVSARSARGTGLPSAKSASATA